MGKSSSKLSAESLERLKFGGGGGGGSGGGGSSSCGPSSSSNSGALYISQTPNSTSSSSSSKPTTKSLSNEKDATSMKHHAQHHSHLSKSFSQELQSTTNSFPVDTQNLNGLLDDQESLISYLKEIFYKEVELSDSMQTLFRGNCLASKIMSQCFRKFGSKYLKQLLEPHIRPLSVISYEIDSTKLVEEDGDIDVNQKNLLKLTKQILDSILSSASDFPHQLNSMCSCLRQVICKKYPNSDTHLKAIGTVIFLRFINPAIVSPYEAGIVDKPPPPKTMRGLMLVSKILQNIANNVEFSKEEHMLPFNDFVRTQFEPMRRWVSEISTERAVDEQPS